MTTTDRFFLTALVNEGKKGIKTLTEKAFKPALFADPDCKVAFNWIKDFYDDFGEMPTRETISKTIGSELIPDTETQGVKFYLDEMKKRQQLSIMVHLNDDIVSILDSETLESVTSGVEDARQKIIDAAKKLVLEAVESNTFDITKTIDDRKREFLERQKGGGITGIPTYWEPLTKTTRGWQGGHTYMFSAQSNVGKTWTLILNAYKAFSLGHSPLLFTQEMSQIEIATRFDSIASSIPYSAILEGDSEAQEAYFNFLDLMKDRPQDDTTFYVNEKAGGKGIEYIISQIEDIMPSIVFIDNIYLFAKSLDYKDILDISVKLKNCAQALNIPIVFCMQMNEDGSLSFAKGVKNDVSGAYRIYPMAPHKLRRVVDEKARDNDRTGEFCFNFEFDTMNFDYNPDFILGDGSGVQDDLVGDYY